MSKKFTSKIENDIVNERNFVAAILDTIDALVVVLNRDGKIVRFNRACERATSYSAEEVLDKNFAEIFLLPEQFEEVSQVLHELVSGRYPNHHENYWITKQGEKRLISWSNTVLLDTNGEVEYIVATGVDITERRQAEEAIQVYTEKLKQANRELRDFSYIASHDLQEPLRKIQLFGERLKNQFQDQLGTEGADYIHRMTNAAQRMDLMLRGLLEYTRITQNGQPRVPVDLNQILQDVLSDLDYRVEQSGAEVLVGPLPLVDADPTQMGQLFQNLIGNALKFFVPDRHPQIKITSSEPPAEDGANQWIEIRVEDNGIGFSEQYVDRIFQPFQRLHGRAEYDGNGMGLAICRKIVERHGGSITATSTPGQGAAFIIRLPKISPTSDLENITA